MTDKPHGKDSHQGDVDFIAALAELLNRNDLAEISVKREYADNDSLNVRVTKYATGPAPAAPAAVYAAPAAPAAPAASAGAPAAAPAGKRRDGKGSFRGGKGPCIGPMLLIG